ncbi:MAG: YihY/virulence factor BrkB family protein [Chloroflexota bacterium]|nr:YihY/virulence factor BrkB family protein [Chloroflexota bacterium]
MKDTPDLANNNLKKKITDTYNKVNQRSGGIIEILPKAFNSFSDVHGAEGAASVAYFVFFSLIPLFLLLVSIAGFLLVDIDAIDQILDFISPDIPLPRDLIESNLRQLMKARNIGSIVAIIGLIWSASGSFISFCRNINRAWPNAKRLNFVQGRLIALAIVAALVIMIIIWYAGINITNFILSLDIPIIQEIEFEKSLLWQLSSTALPWVVVFLAFLILYRWVPNTRVRWIEAFWGALIASIAIFIGTKGFTWFLQSGVVNYQLIYGSLGTILAFLTWVYITTFIAIIGAHISSAIATIFRDKGNNPPQPEGKSDTQSN